MRNFIVVFASCIFFTCTNIASAQFSLVTTAASDGAVVDGAPFDGAFETVDSNNNPEARSLFGQSGQIFRSRGIFEFEIPTNLSGQAISNVQIDLRSVGFDPGVATFFLYSGNGSVETDDATETVGALGSYLVPDRGTGSPIGNDFIQDLPFADFQFLLDSGASHFGIRFEVPNDDTFVTFLSVENSVVVGQSSFAPTLIISTVPEPTCTVLLCGLGVVFACQRRRR